MIKICKFIVINIQNVAYWPTTRPGWQNRKCTYVNNRCIRSRNIRIITLTVDGLNECNLWRPQEEGGVNYYITECTGNSISLETRPVGDKMRYWKPAPSRLGPQASGWAAQESGKETQLWPIEWGSICCSSVRSPTPSHTQPFQIKWEVYFSKNCVARLYCVVVMILHASVDVYVLCDCIVGHGCDNTTKRYISKSIAKDFLENIFSSIISFFVRIVNPMININPEGKRLDSEVFS